MLTMSNTGTSLVTTTLYEKCQNTVNPYFTWNVFQKSGQKDIIFYQNDISSNPFYYNQFELTVGTLSALNGVIPVIQGEWIYNIYEMISPYDLDLNHAQGIVETGLLIVAGTYSQLISYPDGYVPLKTYLG